MSVNLRWGSCSPPLWETRISPWEHTQSVTGISKLLRMILDLPQLYALLCKKWRHNKTKRNSSLCHFVLVVFGVERPEKMSSFTQAINKSLFFCFFLEKGMMALKCCLQLSHKFLFAASKGVCARVCVCV